MKKFVLGLTLTLLFWVIISCESTAVRHYRSISKIPNANVIGTLQVNFESYNDAHPVNNSKHNEMAYNALLETAKKNYSGIIDIADISWNLIKREDRIFHYSASGKVISIKDGKRTTDAIEFALKNAIEEISKTFSPKMQIAIIYITAYERGVADFIAGELEHVLIQRGFKIVDRSELDRVRAEQRLGVSGEINDSTAARIGKITGASVVITGRVDGEGDLRRLRLRALDTTSALVIGTASEKL